MTQWIKQLSNSEYRQSAGISNSDLSLISQSMSLLEWSRNAPREESDAAEIGTAVHAALLEPDEFSENYRRMPKFNRATKDGKEQAAAFEATNAGKIILPCDDYDKVIAMLDSVLAHPTAKALLTSPGWSESSIFFEMNGVKCKCRPDRIVEPSVFSQHIIVDLKTTDDIDKFAFSVRDYRYHCQDAFYTEGYRQHFGELPRFIFVVVGKKRCMGRYPVRVLELRQEDKDAGRAKIIENLERVSEFESFGAPVLDVEELAMAKEWK